MRSAPRGGTSPAHRPLTGPDGPVRWAGNERLAVTCAACSPIAPAANERFAVTRCGSRQFTGHSLGR